MNSMNRFFPLIFIICLMVLSLTKSEAQNNAKNIKVGPQPDGSFLVPTNQLLRPAGFQVYFPGRPVDLALIPDKKLLIVKNKKINRSHSHPGSDHSSIIRVKKRRQFIYRIVYFKRWAQTICNRREKQNTDSRIG